MEVRSQRERCSRDTSPDRAKMCRLKQQLNPPTPGKVQVVYYLSRNGLLEHPHFMELTLLPRHPLRLKDVCDRLMALRGSSMPLQYSWSSKRKYKSGYVWQDLALKDIIHPADGGEYVLKGSELIQGSSERFEELNLGNKQAIHQVPEPNFSYNPKQKSLSSAPEPEEFEEYEDQQDKEYEEGEKASSYTSSTTTPLSRCSRGVSTEELVRNEEDNDAHTNTTRALINTNLSPHGPPPPPCNSAATLAEKLNHQGGHIISRRRNNQPKRLGDEVNESSAPSRHSVLLQLIACGSSALEFKAKHEPRLSNVGTKKRENVDRDRDRDRVDDDRVFSEDPRLLGKLKCEEKEYFSGSLVESMKAMEAEPELTRSNSYDEQRRSRLGMGEVKLKVVEENRSESKGGVKEKCIPRKKSSKDTNK